jgi:Membrane domain of glycerophosphoryl diester phosphodiesterase
MVDILYPPARPQSVGEVLDTAFRIYTGTLLKCLPYSFTSVVLGQLLALYDLIHGHPLNPLAGAFARANNARDPLWWLLLLVLMVATVVLANAILLRQYALATGRPLDMRAELSQAVRYTPGTWLIAFLMVLAMGVSLVPLMFVFGGLGAALGKGALGLGPMLAILVILAYVVAASWVIVRWICAAPIYVLTSRGPVESMSYSWQLSAGGFWRLSAIYSVALVLMMVFYFFAGVVGMMVALLLGHGDVPVVLALSQALVALLTALFAPFYYALVLAVYGDLSVRREGSDLARRLAGAAAA